MDGEDTGAAASAAAAAAAVDDVGGRVCAVRTEAMGAGAGGGGAAWKAEATAKYLDLMERGKGGEKMSERGGGGRGGGGACCALNKTPDELGH